MVGSGCSIFPLHVLRPVVCVYGFLRYHVGGSKRWAAVSGSALVGGLLFYEKPAYMPVYLLLFRVLLMAPQLRPRKLLVELWRERLLWITYVVILVIWTAGYLHSGAYSGSSLGDVTLSQYITYFRIMWLQTLVPSMASITIPASHLDALQTMFVVVSQVVVAGCVVVYRKRSAWRAWAFLMIIVLISGGLVARSRIAQFGVDIANDPRYLIDFAWLVPLALCGAFGRGKVLTPRLADANVRFVWARPRTLAPLLASAVLIVYVGGAVASAMQLQRDWPGSQSRTWEQHLRRSFSRLKSSRAPFVVADNATPFAIMEPFVAPYNRLSRVLDMYVGSVQVDGPLDGTLQVVGEDGATHRATTDPTVSSATFGELVRSRQVRFGGGREVVSGREVCVIADAAPVQVERQLPVPPSVGDAPYYLRLQYHVWEPTSLPVFVNAGPGYPGSTTYSIALQPGVDASIAWLGPESPHSVLLTIPALTTVCIGRLDIVTLRNAS